MSSQVVINEALQSELDVLQSMYDDAISIQRKASVMNIEYITKMADSCEIKIIFTFDFDIDALQSSTNILVKNVNKNKRKFNQQSLGNITFALNDKFKSMQDTEDMPIYQCIEYFNDELKSNESLLVQAAAPCKHDQVDRKESEAESKMEQEHIAFIRFNHLLHGKQHKKESQMLSELKDLKNCSPAFFGHFFYGKPGLIAICSTSDIIKQFAQKCNNIGKKAVISFITDAVTPKCNNAVQTVMCDNKERLDLNALNALLKSLEQSTDGDALSRILTGGGTDFPSSSSSIQSKPIVSQDTYRIDSSVKDKSITFEVVIKTSNGPYATCAGNLYMTIFGKNDTILVDKFKFEIKSDIQDKKRKKTSNVSFQFAFEDIDFLNAKIGTLSKILFENDSIKDSWQCEWVKVYVYQIRDECLYEYEGRLKKWVNKHTPRHAYLSCTCLMKQ